MPVPQPIVPKTNATPSTNGQTNGKPRVSVPRAPRIVNRGSTGLLTKLTDYDREHLIPEVVDVPKVTKTVAKYRIAPDLQHMAVPIDSVTRDPVNARLHPERNMDAIKASLEQYGQVVPIVARKDTRVIVAGNGRHQAMCEMGWTEVAVHFADLSEIEATGYGIADNRTADLATWDEKVLKILDRALMEAGHQTIGWSDDELQVIRAAVWVKPSITDEQFGVDNLVTMKFTPEQAETIGIAVGMIREREGDKKMSEGACLMMVVNEWFPRPSYETNGDTDEPIPF